MYHDKYLAPSLSRVCMWLFEWLDVGCYVHELSNTFEWNPTVSRLVPVITLLHAIYSHPMQIDSASIHAAWIEAYITNPICVTIAVLQERLQSYQHCNGRVLLWSSPVIVGLLLSAQH